MKISELMTVIDQHVPLATAEEWDNVGLIIGDESAEVNGILTALDCTKAIVEEAISAGVNTIICHHPLIFKGIKNITQNDGYGAIIRKLIQNDINVIALHTNLDVYPHGVNAMLADRLGLQQQQILDPEDTNYYKVYVYIPKDDVETFKQQLDQAGLARTGNYHYCFFEAEGQSQFKPVDDANPTIGQLNEIEYVNEVKLEFMIDKGERTKVQQLILQHHPYEEPVFDFIPVVQTANLGLGMIGELEHALDIETFIDHVKTQLDMPSVRFIGDLSAKIKTVALIGGAGIGNEYMAAAQGADIFLTGDIKHHEALDAKTAGINLLDINHYSEHVMREGLVELLKQWLSEADISFDIHASEQNTDPFNYY